MMTQIEEIVALLGRCAVAMESVDRRLAEVWPQKTSRQQDVNGRDEDLAIYHDAEAFAGMNSKGVG